MSSELENSDLRALAYFIPLEMAFRRSNCMSFKEGLAEFEVSYWISLDSFRGSSFKNRLFEILTSRLRIIRFLFGSTQKITIYGFVC